MVPVKLYQKYTIAIDSNMPIEICCGFYGAYLDTKNVSTTLSKITYQKINSSTFSKPFIYDKLTGDKLNAEEIELLNIAQNEDDLKLFIKVPINNKSSITILEGDYLGYNDSLYDPKSEVIRQNRTITNFFEGKDDLPKTVEFDEDYLYAPLNNREFKPISKLQLLMMNTGVSYPFADRLIEYLSENAITKLDRLPDNIKRAQTILSSAPYSNNTKKYNSDVYGLWDDKLSIYLYDSVVNNDNINRKYSTLKHDLLGYIDKDTEKLVTRKNNKTKVVESISKIDLYTNMYNNTYLTDKTKFKDWEEANNE
jgi:hypothetical protein